MDDSRKNYWLKGALIALACLGLLVLSPIGQVYVALGGWIHLPLIALGFFLTGSLFGYLVAVRRYKILVVIILIMVSIPVYNVYQTIRHRAAYEKINKDIASVKSIADLPVCEKLLDNDFRKKRCYENISYNISDFNHCSQLPLEYHYSCASGIRIRAKTLAPCQILKNQDDLHSCYFTAGIPAKDMNFILTEVCPHVTHPTYKYQCGLFSKQ